MLNREKRLELNEIFKRKNVLIGWIKDNTDLVNQYKTASLIEENERTFKAMKAKIRRGEGIISNQKIELLGISIPKIVAMTGVGIHQVRYQEMLFNKARIVL